MSESLDEVECDRCRSERSWVPRVLVLVGVADFFSDAFRRALYVAGSSNPSISSGYFRYFPLVTHRMIWPNGASLNKSAMIWADNDYETVFRVRRTELNLILVDKG